MLSFRISALSLLLVATLGIPTASALTIDDNGRITGSAASLNAPDDQVPYPHLDDNGQPSHDFHSQGTVSFSPGHDQSDAFERAQQRMQQ